MSQVLYRKYRPQSFAEVIGQDIVKTIIKNALRLSRISHAYLFCGPRGVGKTTVARLLAKAVNCLNPKNGEPDTTCENCLAIQTGRFLDLVEIDAASYTGVDNIRGVIELVKFSPSKGKYKVFIIDEVHMLSKAAFNALLKTLEEPPSHAIFILATTEIYKVPLTIVSRTQRFDFRKVSQAEILKLFGVVLPDLKFEIPHEAQILIAQSAEGSFRDALSILDQLVALGNKKITLEEVEEILGISRLGVNQKFLDLLARQDGKSATRFVKDLTFAGRDLVQFTKNFLEYLRLVLFVKMGIEKIDDLGLNAEESHKLKEQSEELLGTKLLEIIKRVLEAHREAKLSPVPELSLLSQILVFTGEEEKIKETAQEPPPLSSTPQVKPDKSRLDLGTIIDRWAEVLSRVKEYNHSLLGSLRLGRVVRLEGGELILAFPYNFHKETVEARKNRIVVEQVLQEVFAVPVKVKAFLERELQDAKLDTTGDDLLSEAIKVLGE